MTIPIMSEQLALGETPEILFWVGCAGSFDQRAQKITKAFVTILNKVGIKYAILGKEEMCTGDPARRAPTLGPLGQPEKAMGHESQIEPWLTSNDHVPLCWFQNRLASLRRSDENRW